jgi:hypothetical protein
MREDLLGPKVENVGLALVELPIENAEPEYVVFLINNRDDIMEGIIVTSTGFGENPTTGESVKTSTLRKGIEVMMPGEAARIEPIMPDLFDLSNEFWVSFWVHETMYDKRFVFAAGTIIPKEFKLIPSLNARGIILD